jgi:hypothetical protein
MKGAFTERGQAIFNPALYDTDHQIRPGSSTPQKVKA